MMKAPSNRVFRLLNARKIHTKYLFNSSSLVSIRATTARPWHPVLPFPLSPFLALVLAFFSSYDAISSKLVKDPFVWLTS